MAEGYRTAGTETILGRCRQMGLGLPMTRALATLLAIAGTETGASGTSRTVALLHDTGFTIDRVHPAATACSIIQAHPR